MHIISESAKGKKKLDFDRLLREHLDVEGFSEDLNRYEGILQVQFRYDARISLKKDSTDSGASERTCG